MAWANSKIYTSFLTDILNNTTAMDLNTDAAIKVSLFDNTVTPSQSAASASTAYNTGAWVSGFVFDAVGWPQVGRDLVSVTSGFASNVYTFDAADTVSANSTTTLTNAFGALIYDDTITTPVADQGICYLYFGGSNSVTSGTFTVVYSVSGIFTLTL